MSLVSSPLLRRLSNVDRLGPLTPRQKGNIIREYISDTIEAMDGVYKFRGNSLDAELLRRVLFLLLDYTDEGYGHYAIQRRYRVIEILELNAPLEQFRRANSPERDLLRLLAVEIVSQSAS